MILDQNRGPARSSGNIDRSRRHHHCPARLYAIYAREFQPVRNAFLGQAPRSLLKKGLQHDTCRILRSSF